jgi:hypothetical protein
LHADAKKPPVFAFPYQTVSQFFCPSIRRMNFFSSFTLHGRDRHWVIKYVGAKKMKGDCNG